MNSPWYLLKGAAACVNNPTCSRVRWRKQFFLPWKVKKSENTRQSWRQNKKINEEKSLWMQSGQSESGLDPTARNQSVCRQRCGNNNRSNNNPDCDQPGCLHWGQHDLAQEEGENVPTWSGTQTPWSFPSVGTISMRRLILTPFRGTNGFGPEPPCQKSSRRRTTGSLRWTSARLSATRAGSWTWSCAAELRMESSHKSGKLERMLWCTRTVNSARGSCSWTWRGCLCLDYPSMTF